MPLQLVNFTEACAGDCAGFKVGFLSGEMVADLQRVNAACSTVKSDCDCLDCWTSALGVVTCEPCFVAARGYAEWFAAQDKATQADLASPRSEVKLLAPVPAPGKVFCLAQNFPSHVGETKRIMRQKDGILSSMSTPKIFMKPTPNTICGDGDPILVGPKSTFVDYEAEICIIIGKTCKYVDIEDAGECIGAVTCLNDVSERNMKIWEREEVGEWDKFFDWLNGKWYDNSAPMGPCLVSAREVDVDDLELRCYVNGELRQTGNTGEMYHNAAQTISYLSQFVTLEPGDIIAMGTPGGVGKGMDKKLVPGDEVIVELEGVGRLTNPVEAESE